MQKNTNKKKNIFSEKSGFTLLEILLVIGIIAVLAVVIIVALNPAKRFEDARNSRRLSDIQSILSAIQQYMVDNNGSIPSGITTSEMQIGGAGEGCELDTEICDAFGGGCANLAEPLGPYLKEIPLDPENGSIEFSHYSVQMDANNIVTVRACESTDETISSVSR